jgi:hypothetical protein
VYYGNVRNFDTTTLNQLCKYQLLSTTSYDVRKIALSSVALNMHSLRAAYKSGYLWAYGCHNVSLTDISLWGYIWKDTILVPDWLQNHNSFKLEDFLSTYGIKQQDARHASVQK